MKPHRASRAAPSSTGSGPRKTATGKRHKSFSQNPRRAQSTGRQLDYHPLANCFPLMEGAKFDALVEDIRKHGVREPIWRYEGKILDGRNRWRASQAAGVDCPVQEYTGSDPVSLVISLNLNRRHLNEGQRAMIAVHLATLPHGGDRRQAPIGVLKDADELNAAVQSGNIAVSKVAEVAALPIERQTDIMSTLQRDAFGKLTPEATKALPPLVREIREEAVAAKTANRAAREVALGAKQQSLPTKRTTPSAARQNISSCETGTGFERLLTASEAANFLHVSPSWLAKCRMRGDGPPFVKFGRCVRYPEETLAQWTRSHFRRSTSD
jgi:ParB-like chromosome segregation protein Spo0J